MATHGNLEGILFKVSLWDLQIALELGHGILYGELLWDKNSTFLTWS